MNDSQAVAQTGQGEALRLTRSGGRLPPRGLHLGRLTRGVSLPRPPRGSHWLWLTRSVSRLTAPGDCTGRPTRSGGRLDRPGGLHWLAYAQRRPLGSPGDCTGWLGTSGGRLTAPRGIALAGPTRSRRPPDRPPGGLHWLADAQRQPPDRSPVPHSPPQRSAGELGGPPGDRTRDTLIKSQCPTTELGALAMRPLCSVRSVEAELAWLRVATKRRCDIRTNMGGRCALKARQEAQGVPAATVLATQAPRVPISGGFEDAQPTEQSGISLDGSDLPHGPAAAATDAERTLAWKRDGPRIPGKILHTCLGPNVGNPDA